MSNLAFAASIAHGIIVLGHTRLGLELFQRPVWSALSTLEFAYSRAGWYQGSISFLIFSLFNYQLSRRDPSTWSLIERTILVLILGLCWATSAWYLTSGDRATGVVLSVVGGLQGLTLYG